MLPHRGFKLVQLDDLDDFVFEILKHTTPDNRDPDVTSFMADIIAKNIPFACDEGGGSYCYYKGKYHANGMMMAERLSETLYRQLGAWRRYKSYKGTEIAKLITRGSKSIQLEPSQDKINLLNGIYHVDEEIFKPHDDTYRTTVQIPINYNPDATCPGWDSFLSSVLPYSGGPEYLRDIIALCMIPLTSIQKCIVLFGEGSNGKSVFLSGLQAAIGLDNISNLSLQALTGPAGRFNTVELLGKLVNIFADLPVAKILDASNLKGLTGEDRLPMERKGQQPFFAIPFCRLIFSCNTKVESEDQSEGYKRRFINVPFTQTFEGNVKKGAELKDILSDPNELSGLFNKLIPRFTFIAEEGLVPSMELANVIENYTPTPKEYKNWILENVEVSPNDSIPSSAFYGWFSSHITGHGTHSPQKTVSYMRSIFPSVETGVLTRFPGATNSIRAYKGIRMTPPSLHISIIESAVKHIHLEDKIE